MQIGVQSQPQDNESGLAVLLTLPLSFLGLGAFRAWMWLLPVLSPQAPALEQFHDLLLCAALLLLAALARKVVPIGLNRWAQIVCGITAFAGSSIIALNVAMPFAPAASYVGIAFVALAAAIVILSWCELYACLDIARIALCLALAFLTEQALIFLLEGLPLPYRLGALFLLPATALLSLQRAYTYLPDSMRPRPVPGKLRIPWKLIALLAAYLFVSGVRAGMATSPVNPFSGAASTLVALFLILAIAFFSNRFDLAFAYRTPIFLLVCALLLIPALGDDSASFFAFCLALSTRLFEVVVFLLLSDICQRHAITAVMLFGIEESTNVFSSLGYALGTILHATSHIDLSESMGVLIGIALLIGATLLLFNEKQFETAWGSPLLGPGKIRWDQEQREALRTSCDRIADAHSLTAREREVLELLGKGYSISRVCEELCIAKGTAKAYTDHIYAKLGIHTRRELLDLLDQK